ncbi:MAG: hypothetical protein FGM18_05365 [Burkholderiaceae bacterium]|nr:hypothetical protein [Burkholderiaceae bacterium]
MEAIEGIFPSGIVAFQTTRLGGTSQGPFDRFNLGGHVGDDPEMVAQNRQRLEKCCATFPVWLNQIHGTGVVDLDHHEASPDGTTGPLADASVSSRSGRACAVLTADCLPILVARSRSSGCAAIHAGWRGLNNGVIEATLWALFSRDPTPDCWSFWMGPCIGPEAFEVGEDVRQAFVQRDLAADTAFLARADGSGKYLGDLRRLAEQRIQQWFTRHPHALVTLGSERAAGERPIRLAASHECTVRTPDRFFSFRRDRVTGRMASLIALQTI